MEVTLEVSTGETLITHYMLKNMPLMICMPPEHRLIIKQQQRNLYPKMIRDFDEIMESNFNILILVY
jgi:hypothetical protein